MDNIKFTVEAYGQKLEITTPRDSNLTDMYNLFNTIMIWLTRHPDTINSFMKNPEYDDWELTKVDESIEND